MDVLRMVKEDSDKINKDKIIEELYWSSLNSISKEEMQSIVKPFLMESTTINEYSAIQKLYSNPEGAHIDFFEEIIISLYKRDPFTFIRAVNENPDEGMNVLYIFRNKAFFVQAEKSKQELLDKTNDSQTKEMIDTFFRYYDTICST